MYIQPSEPLPSKGGQPDSSSGGSSPKVAPIPPCLHSLGRRGPYPKAQDQGAISNDWGEVDTGKGSWGWDGGQSSPVPLGKGCLVGSGRKQTLKSCS